MSRLLIIGLFFISTIQTAKASNTDFIMPGIGTEFDNELIKIVLMANTVDQELHFIYDNSGRDSKGLAVYNIASQKQHFCSESLASVLIADIYDLAQGLFLLSERNSVPSVKFIRGF